MSRRWPWDALGIDATADTRAIRQAYAVKLKVTDQDDDPQAFAALRQARDAALWEARNSDYEDADDEEADSPPFKPWQFGFDADYFDHVRPRPKSLPDPTSSPEFDNHIEALRIALTKRPLDDAAQAETRAHLDAILTSPEMDGVSTRGAIELWLAALLARAVPASDPLIAPAADAFRWRAHGFELGAPPGVEWLLKRLAALEFAGAVQNPAHKHHRAWLALTNPHHPAAAGVGVKRVRALMALVHHDYPTLEAEFDEGAAHYWRNHRPPVAWGGLALAALGILLVVALRVWWSSLDDDRRGYDWAAAPLSAMRTDISDVVALVGGPELSGQRLQTAKPTLYAELEKVWDRTQRSGGRIGDFYDGARSLLERAVDGNLMVAPYPLVSAYREHTLEIMNAQIRHDEHLCLAYIDGRAALETPPEMAARQFALQRELLLFQHNPATDQPAPFVIPPDIAKAAATRAKLSEPRWKLTMRGQGTARERCDARFAIMEIALEAHPKVGLPLLRAM